MIEKNYSITIKMQFQLTLVQIRTTNKLQRSRAIVILNLNMIKTVNIKFDMLIIIKIH